MDSTSIYNDPALNAARSNYQDAAGAATTGAQQAITLPDMLKQTLSSKFSADNPLLKTREGQLTNYLNTTTQAPLDYTAKSAGGNSDVIYSPEQQANLIQERRSTALAPLTSTNWLLSLFPGGIQNIIDSTGRALQAQNIGLQGRADTARTSYTDLLNELSAKADAAFKQKQFDESTRQYNQDYALRASKAGSGGTNYMSLFPQTNTLPVPSTFVPLQPIQNQPGGTQFDQGTLDAANVANMYALMGGTGNGR